MKKIYLFLIFISTFFTAEAQKDTAIYYKWQYSSSVDEMTSDKSHFASIISHLNEDNHLATSLTVRYMNGRNEVLFSIVNSLFNIGVYGETIYVKFDDGKIESFNCNAPTGNQFDLLFINNSKKFIRELKSSKKLLIKVELYREGNTIFNFNTDSLKWDYLQ